MKITITQIHENYSGEMSVGIGITELYVLCRSKYRVCLDYELDSTDYTLLKLTRKRKNVIINGGCYLSTLSKIKVFLQVL